MKVLDWLLAPIRSYREDMRKLDEIQERVEKMKKRHAARKREEETDTNKSG